MNNRKPQNSIIALAIVLLLAVGSSQMFAQTEKTSEVSINKQPLVDFSRELNRKHVNKEIDLNSPFVVEISGSIDRKGKLDSINIIREEGDRKVIETVKDAIFAFSDAGYFLYLQSMDIREINVLAKQDDVNLSVNLSSLLKTKEKAKALMSTTNAFLSIAPMAVSREKDGENVDSKIFLLKSIKATTDNEKVVIEFAAPKNKIREIITSELAKP